MALPVVGLLSILLGACSSKDQSAQPPPPPPIPVVEVIQLDVPIAREFVGQVYGLKDIPIRARVEGFLEGIHFDEGLPVETGQLLYTIDPQPFEAEVATRSSSLAEAKTMLVRAENDLRRIQPLAEINAVSQSDLDAAVAERDASEASVGAAQSSLRLAQIQLGYTRIYSPIEGVIGKTRAKVGEFVGREPNPVILNEVSRIDSLRVEFFLTETEYLAVAREYYEAYGEDMLEAAARPREERRTKLELILSDGSFLGEPGELDFINREVDPSTGSILLQASFPNPNRIVRPGQFSRVKVEIQVVQGALLVPIRSVIEIQGRFRVVVINSENVAETREVELGPTYKNLWLVNEGLSPGERIVVEGVQRVKDGMTVNPQPREFQIVPAEGETSAQ